MLLRTVPCLPVIDVTVGVEFYRRAFGFRCVHVEPSLAVVVRDRCELHLWAADDLAWLDRSPRESVSPVASGLETFIAGTATCRIEVRGLERIVEGLRSSGLILHQASPIESKPWGSREVSVFDPWWNLIVLYETAP